MLNAYLKKYTGYGFWVSLEVMFFIGLPRLVVFPIAAYLIGKEQFGLFVFALGVVMVVGQAPSMGLATGVIRNMAALEGADKERLVGTSVYLCRIAMFLIVALGTIAVCIMRFLGRIDAKMMMCLLPLLGFLGLWNLIDLQLVRHRVERRFAGRTCWYALLGFLLFLAVPGAYFWGAVGMAWGYMFAFLATYVLLSGRQGLLLKWPVYDVRSAGVLKEVWLHVSIAGVLALSSRYIYRIILGMSHSYSDVSILFGATNIIDLCLSPVNILSSVLLSLLAGFACLADVGGRQRSLVLCGGILMCIAAPVAVIFAGPFILSLLFPEFADESARVLRLIIMIVPCVIITGFSRPFVVKFGSVKLLPLLNLVTLLSHLVPAVLLIPRMGVNGAIVSYNIGYGLTALLWVGALAWTFRCSYRPGSDVETSCFCADKSDNIQKFDRTI